MTFADWSPVLGAIIAVLGGAVVYGYQRRIDRKNTLAERRRELYVSFLSSLVDASNGDTEPHLRSRVEAVLVGSDKVVRALSKYNEIAERTNGTTSKEHSGKFNDALAKVTMAMREDVFEKTNISEQEYPSVIPVKR